MFKKKCPDCAKKIDKKYNFCPFCGHSFKQQKEQDDYGMLGLDDTIKEIRQEIKLPLGLNTIMNSLMKQIEKDLGNMSGKGFKIKISTGNPNQEKIKQSPRPIKQIQISQEEQKRRNSLPKKQAESNIKRIGDRIIYQIITPGIKSKKDVVITKLENSLEIKAYSKDNCYIKTIPLRLELIEYSVEDNSVFLELKQNSQTL